VLPPPLHKLTRLGPAGENGFVFPAGIATLRNEARAKISGGFSVFIAALAGMPSREIFTGAPQGIGRRWRAPKFTRSLAALACPGGVGGRNRTKQTETQPNNGYEKDSDKKDCGETPRQ